MAARIAQLQEVVTAQQAEIQALRMTHQQQQQGQWAPGRAGPWPPDTRLGQPPVFVGDENAFDNWAFKVKAYIGNQSPATLAHMRVVETMQDPEDPAAYTEEMATMSTSLYYKLAMLTDRAALAIVRQVTTNDGFEAYRRLVARYNPRTMGRGLSRLAQLLSFEFGSDESQLLDKILQWERLIDDYEKGGTDVVSDSVRCAVMQSRAPAAVRTHLLLNAPTTADWPSMRRTIQNYLIAASSSSAAVPMEIGAIGKFGGKGKHVKGKTKDSGKHGKKKQDSAPGNAKGQGKDASERFSGYCGRCGKKGHKQKDCWPKVVGSIETNDAGASSSSNQWHEGDWSKSQSQDQGWWGEPAAGSAAPGTLAAITAPDVASAGSPAATGGDGGWIMTTTTDAMVGSLQESQEEIDLMIDSGAESTVCGPTDFPGYPTRREGPEVHLRSADGRPLKWYGRKEVWFEAQGESLRVAFNVVDVVRPILSVATMTDNGNEVDLKRTGGEIRKGTKRLGLARRAGLFLLRVTIMAAVAQTPTSAGCSAAYLAPVSGGAAPVSGGAFQEGHGIAEDARVAVPAPAPERPSAAEVDAHMTTHTPYARWCHDCVMGRGRDDRHESIKTSEPDATPVVQLDYCFNTSDRQCVPVLCAVDNVYHRSMAMWCDRKGSRDGYAVKAVKEFCESLGF